MQQNMNYLIRYKDRFLGIRYDKQTFLNLHDATSEFKLEKVADKYFLKSPTGKYLAEGQENEVILVPDKIREAAMYPEDSETPGDSFLRFESGRYVMGSRYELRHSETKTDDNKLTFLTREAVTDEMPEKVIWGHENTGEMTPPDEVIKRKGFQHLAPTRGIFNWLLNHIYRWLDFLHRQDTALRQDHEQLDAYVRDWFLERNDDVSDAIAQARDARDKAKLAETGAVAASGSAAEAKNLSEQYAASALSSKNAASASASDAAGRADSATASARSAAASVTDARGYAETCLGYRNESSTHKDSAAASAGTAANHAAEAKRDYSEVKASVNYVGRYIYTSEFEINRSNILARGHYQKSILIWNFPMYCRFWLKLEGFIYRNDGQWHKIISSGAEITALSNQLPGRDHWRDPDTNFLKSGDESVGFKVHHDGLPQLRRFNLFFYRDYLILTGNILGSDEIMESEVRRGEMFWKVSVRAYM